ncbi:nuclear transport factor 2 family protein [Emticicia agri]|uniref:Nuclear transport factor 2 family protein n=1 Tax=Emticicia agri TaxID=2492393 RepID=A0A4Q5LVW9_9BACT|nr:nuclear transport factor 2 family protein [Emticicia agri]RYU93891.1 nuclear transport factor 2 family protein [Emticicia agri]
MIKVEAQKFAEEWVAAWNSHDMDRIMSHYSNDLTITTPMIKTIMGIEEGALSNLEAIRNYWETALKKVPDLHFELFDAVAGVNSVAIYYKSIMEKRVIEVMFLDDNGKVNKMYAHYS